MLTHIRESHATSFRQPGEQLLDLGRATVFRSIKEGETRGLLERSERGIRATEKWINAVEIYSINKK